MTFYIYVQYFLPILMKYNLENFQTIALSKMDNYENRDSENSNYVSGRNVSFNHPSYSLTSICMDFGK
jgi:hypothetical protein